MPDDRRNIYSTSTVQYVLYIIIHLRSTVKSGNQQTWKPDVADLSLLVLSRHKVTRNNTSIKRLNKSHCGKSQSTSQQKMVLSNTVKKTSGAAKDSGGDEAGYEASALSPAVKLALADSSSGALSDEPLQWQATREKAAALALADDSAHSAVMLNDLSLKAQDARDGAVSLALREDCDGGDPKKVGKGTKKQAQKQTIKSNTNEKAAETLSARHELSKSEASNINVGIGAYPHENKNDGAEEPPQLTSLSRGRVALIPSRPGAVAVEGMGGGEVDGAMAENTVADDQGISEQLRSVGTSGASSGYNSSLNDDYDLEGMAEARPVDEEDLGNLQNAQPVSGAGNSKLPRTPLQKQEQRSTQCCLITAAIMAVGLIVGMSVIFTREDNNETISTVLPTGSPTDAPTTVTFALELPEYTLSELQDPASPQSKAYDWILGNPGLGNYPEWKKAQRFALATFYFSLGGGDWILEDDWLNPELDECAWFHRELIGSPQNVGGFDQLDELSDLVELADSACDDNGRYRFLVFPNNNLKGTLPKEIALLSTGLVFLEISANGEDDESPADSLRGSIPTEIGLLTELRRFYSDRNLHTGPIPTELGLLQNLVELDIGYSPFSGGVPTELGNLGDSLKLLSIKRSGVTGFLPTELYQLTNLETFFLHGNTGITGGLLSPDIQNMKKMQRFVAHDIPYQSSIPCM